MSENTPVFQNEDTTPVNSSAEQVVNRRILKQLRAQRNAQKKLEKASIIQSYRNGEKKQSVFHIEQRSEVIQQILSHSSTAKLNVSRLIIAD